MKFFTTWSSLRISLIYMVIGALWIFLSDHLLEAIFPNFNDYAAFQTIKGVFFVFGTGLLIFFLMYREFAKRDRVEARLKKNLEEKKILVHEVNHRVKNNLNSIISFLYIQRENFSDPELIHQFTIAINRIYSMALIHEHLYSSSHFDQIDFGKLIPELIRNIRTIDAEATRDINFEIEIDTVVLNMNQAIPCAILINEIVTNSIKHGFPEGTPGTIFIRMSRKDSGFHLVAGDTGVGFPGGWDSQVGKGLGLTLITSLAKQLGGEIQITAGHGTMYEITF